MRDIERIVRPYSPRHARLAESLASQAAVAIHNSRLFASIHRLFEGFVHASVTAIESRDPTTSGHSFRVANLTGGLAEVVDRCATGPYGATHFSADEMMEPRYAALLHDFGKVRVREQVLVKAKKLLPRELDRIRQRVELIKGGLELRYAGRKIEHLLDRGRRGYSELAAALDAEIGRVSCRARRQLEPRRHRQRADGPAERLLSRIPWTREFRGIPEIAGSHHEKLDGTGYPYGVKAEGILVQSKMLTIADIYDALTAADRPYKKALPRQEALDILSHEGRAGRLDGALLDLFIAAKIYEQAASAPAVIPPRADRRRPTR